jgi:methyl-accepting chemotaxis protein
MSAKGEEKEAMRAQGGWATWLFASWPGRGMMLLLVIVCALSGFILREGRFVAESSSEEAVARRLGVLADEAAHSVSRLVTLLTCEGVESEGKRLEEAERALGVLDAIEGQPIFRLDREVTSIRNLLLKVGDGGEGGLPEAEAEGGWDDGELADGLKYQLLVLEEALREKELKWLSEKDWDLSRATARRSQTVAAVLMLAFLAFVWPSWMGWQGKRKLARQIRDLEDGEFGGVVPVEKWDDDGDVREGVNNVSSLLAKMKSAASDQSARERKTARQLTMILEALAVGNFTRRFDSGNDDEWAPAAAALNDLVGRLRDEWEEREALEAESIQTIRISKDDVYLLEKMLHTGGDELTAILAMVPGDSPVREFASNLARVGGGQRLALTSIEERLRSIREGWNAVAGSVERREDDLEKEYEFIHETSSTVDQVSVAAKQSSQMVEHVFRASQKAMNTAGEGKELVNQSIDGMDVISQQVSAIAHHILDLSKKAQEVGNIVRVVGEVSKQTNLLALNAAIEAAGAGEHGKGFAVVAKEIRELAVKSSRSTQAIEKLIQEMQDATNTAVLSTEEGSKSVQAGVRTINSLDTSFGNILERFQEVVESAQQISTASQEQTTGARQVASSIGSIDRMMLTSLRDLQAMKTRLDDFQQVVVDLEELIRVSAVDPRKDQ